MKTREIKLMFCAAAIALLVVGCGGGGSSDSTATVTKAQFVKEANAICEQANKVQLAAAAIGEKQGKTRAELISQALIPIQTQAEEVGKLDPPQGDQQQIDAIVKGLEDGVKVVEADPTAFESAFTKVDKLAVKYGLTSCTGP